MADYGTKYKCKYYDVLKREYQLELRRKNYSGLQHTLRGGGSPVTITDPNQGSNKFKPMHGTAADIRLIPDPVSLDYDFFNDFKSITDRDWQAVLRLKERAGIYQSVFGINTLSIINTSTDPIGSFTITNTGGIATTPTCFVETSINNFPPAGTSKPMSFWAVPEGESVNSPNARGVGFVTVYSTDENDNDWINRLIASNPNFARYEGSNVLQFTLNNYDPYIDSGWQIKVDYWPEQYGAHSPVYSNFTGRTEKQWMAVNWINEDTQSDQPLSPVALAYREWDDQGETAGEVALDLAAQINGKAIENVLLGGERIPLMEFESYASGATVYVILLKVADLGNGTVIKEPLTNNTYLRVFKRDGADYTWTVSNFAGGDAGGDTFQLQIDKGAGYQTISQTTGYAGDTIATIMSRIIVGVNTTYEVYEAEINENNADEAYLRVYENASTYTFRFISNGGSALYPTLGVFTSIEDFRTKWIGWIVPGQIEKPHQPGNIEYKLTALDGLGSLKNAPFEINNEMPFQKITLLKLISIALQQTGFNLRIYEAFDIYPVETDPLQRPLDQVYEDSSRLAGKNCYLALEEIVRLARARLVQRNGHWEIQPIKGLISGSITYRTYDYIGNYLQDIVNSDIHKETGGENRDNIFINRSALKAYESAFKQVTTNQEYGLVPQLIKLPTFNYIDDNLNNVKYPWKWMYNGAIQTSFLDKVYRSGKFVRIAEKAPEQSGPYYIEQDFTIGNIDRASWDKPQFELKITHNQYPDLGYGYAANLTVRVILTDGVNTIYLYTPEDEPDNWDINLQTMSFENIGDKKKTQTVKFDYPEDLVDLQEVDGKIQIFQQTDGLIELESVEIKVNTTAPSEAKNSAYYSEVVTDLSSEVLDEDFTLGDAADILSAKQIYKNILFWKDTEGVWRPTYIWNEDPLASDQSDAAPIIDHIRYLYLKEYANQVAQLTADIRGPLELFDIVIDKTQGDTKYVLIGGSWNTRMATIQGEYQELGIDDSAYTRINEVKVTEESSGSDSYSTSPGGTSDVDLSEYVKVDQLETAIQGKTGEFTGADLDSEYSITIFHKLNISQPFVYLYEDLGNGQQRQIDFSNYTINPEDSTNYVILTIVVPMQPTTKIKYRIL